MHLLYIATFFVALFSSILSGMAGGGGGFITIPYWLLIGMTPAQGATTGGFMAIGMGASSLAAFRHTEHTSRDKKLTTILTAITIVAAISGALILPHIEVGSFKIALAILTILSVPLLFTKRKNIHLHKHSRCEICARRGRADRCNCATSVTPADAQIAAKQQAI
jgi:uncharacterized membrane protein YfcA